VTAARVVPPIRTATPTTTACPTSSTTARPRRTTIRATPTTTPRRRLRPLPGDTGSDGRSGGVRGGVRGGCHRVAAVCRRRRARRTRMHRRQLGRMERFAPSRPSVRRARRRCSPARTRRRCSGSVDVSTAVGGPTRRACPNVHRRPPKPAPATRRPRSSSAACVMAVCGRRGRPVSPSVRRRPSKPVPVPTGAPARRSGRVMAVGGRLSVRVRSRRSVMPAPGRPANVRPRKGRALRTAIASTGSGGRGAFVSRARSASMARCRRRPVRRRPAARANSPGPVSVGSGPSSRYARRRPSVLPVRSSAAFVASTAAARMSARVSTVSTPSGRARIPTSASTAVPATSSAPKAWRFRSRSVSRARGGPIRTVPSRGRASARSRCSKSATSRSISTRRRSAGPMPSGRAADSAVAVPTRSTSCGCATPAGIVSTSCAPTTTRS
jgi:hypothetical protein